MLCLLSFPMRMRVCILALLLACLLCCAQCQCPSPASLPAQCHYNCSVLVCGSSTPNVTSTLRINQCSDPLALTLTVDLSGTQFTQEYSVGSPQEVTTCSSHGVVELYSTFRRTTTDLLIQVTGVYESDIAFAVIPSLSLPLTAHSCMCQSMEAVADSFSLDIPLVPLQYNCSRGEDCSSVLCTISNNQVSFIFDPCSESILMVGSSSTSGQSGSLLFNQTEDRTFSQGGNSVTIHVNLTNHNFSMDFSAAVTPSIAPLQFQVFPLNKVMLDRSSCGSHLTYYPSPLTPVSTCTSTGTGGTPPATSTSGPVTSLPSHCPHIALPSSCQLLANCSGITCTSHYTTAVMVVDKCSDPLMVDLTITAIKSSDPLYRAIHYVGGPVLTSYHNQDTGVHVSYSRNSSHLNFTVMSVFEGDIAVMVIPDVEFPLDPHSCSCQSLNTLVSEVSVPPVPSLNCSPNPNCSSIDCVIGGASVNVLFHPCDEVVVLTQGQLVKQIVFNQTESRAFSFGNFNLTADVTLVNHNFSMDFQLNFMIKGSSAPLIHIPCSQVSLDRSVCDTRSLKYYPGDPPAPVIIIPGVPPTPLIPVSVTAIAVSVPLVVVLSLVIVVTVVVCVGVALRGRKRNADTYYFRQLTDDDDYNEDA